MVSPAFFIPLAVSAILGAIAGAALRWAAPQQGWNIFIAAFLWAPDRCGGQYDRAVCR